MWLLNCQTSLLGVCTHKLDKYVWPSFLNICHDLITVTIRKEFWVKYWNCFNSLMCNFSGLVCLFEVNTHTGVVCFEQGLLFLSVADDDSWKAVSVVLFPVILTPKLTKSIHISLRICPHFKGGAWASPQPTAPLSRGETNSCRVRHLFGAIGERSPRTKGTFMVLPRICGEGERRTPGKSDRWSYRGRDGRVEFFLLISTAPACQDGGISELGDERVWGVSKHGKVNKQVVSFCCCFKLMCCRSVLIHGRIMNFCIYIYLFSRRFYWRLLTNEGAYNILSMS